MFLTDLNDPSQGSVTSEYDSPDRNTDQPHFVKR